MGGGGLCYSGWPWNVCKRNKILRLVQRITISLKLWRLTRSFNCKIPNFSLSQLSSLAKSSCALCLTEVFYSDENLNLRTKGKDSQKKPWKTKKAISCDASYAVMTLQRQIRQNPFRRKACSRLHMDQKRWRSMALPHSDYRFIWLFHRHVYTLCLIKQKNLLFLILSIHGWWEELAYGLRFVVRSYDTFQTICTFAQGEVRLD